MNKQLSSFDILFFLLSCLIFPIQLCNCAKTSLSQPTEVIKNTQDTLLKKNESYLIKNCNIIDIKQGTIKSNQHILIKDGLIIEINASINSPKDVVEFDAAGKFVLPGLMNLHTHTSEPNDFFLNLANGVTTVRHLWGNEKLLELRQHFKENPQLGPDLYVASAGFEEPPSYWPEANLIEKHSDIEGMVKAQKEKGFDFIKVYEKPLCRCLFVVKESS